MTSTELKALRQSRKLTQAQLTTLLQLKQRGRITVSEWENNKRVIGEGYALAIKLLFGLVPVYKSGQAIKNKNA